MDPEVHSREQALSGANIREGFLEEAVFAIHL